MSGREIERVRKAGFTALRWYRISLAVNVALVALVVLLAVTR